MDYIYVGNSKLIHRALVSCFCDVSNLKIKGLENNLPIYSNISEFMNIGESLSEIKTLIYAYDILSYDSISFIRSISNLKKFNINIIVILIQNISEFYIQKLYDLGADLIVKPNFEFNELEKIFVKNIKRNETVFDYIEADTIRNIDKLKTYTEESELKTIIHGWAKSNRKKILIKCIASGYSNDEITDIANLSPGTVRNYISQLTTLLNCENRTKLAFLLKNEINEEWKEYEEI